MRRCSACHRRLSYGASCPQCGTAAEPLPADQAKAPPEPLELVGVELLRLLGKGGFAAVWEAKDQRWEDTLALKVSYASDSLTQARFAREARVLADIGPPTVPRLFDSGILGDRRAFLMMELLRGESLDARLAQWPSLCTLEEFERVATSIVECVAGVHARRVMHRDLKPENIFLCRDEGGPDRATVMDFGLAKGTSAVTEALTEADVVIGTWEYMAPEQITVERDIGVRADVYALGVVLYELLTLRVPFSGSRAEVEQGHRYRRPPRPSSVAPVPSALEAVVMRCLAKQPEARYADAADVADALRQALAEVPLAEKQAARQRSDATPAERRAESATRVGTPASSETLALIFLSLLETDVGQVRRVLESWGAHLLHISGTQAVGGIWRPGGGHPVKQAIRVAEQMVTRTLAAAAVVDIGEVRVRISRDKAALFRSPLFTQPERYPAPAERGVMLSLFAHESIPAVECEPLPERSDRFLVSAGQFAEGGTRIASESTSLVGRSRELEALLEVARRSRESLTPALALVLSKPGLGKSHLCAALVERLAREGYGEHVIALRAGEPIAIDADTFPRDFLLGLLDLAPDATPELRASRLRERLGEEVATSTHVALALALGWITAEDTDVRAHRAAPGALRAGISQAVRAALIRRAQLAPFAVVLDDAHWATPAILDGVELASAAEESVPLVVYVFARPTLSTVRPGWGERARSFARTELGPLDEAESAELSRRLLRPAEHVPAAVLERLYERTRGIPLALISLVRGLRREGFLQPSTEGSGWYFATELIDKLPDLPSITWLANQEIEALPPDLEPYVRLAAALGEFEAKDFLGVLHELDALGGEIEFRLDGGVALAEMKRTDLLIVHASGLHAFRHALVRDAIVESTPTDLFARIQQAACRFFRRHGEVSTARRRRRLAHHAAAAGERAEAAALFLEAAEAARDHHAYVEADLLYTSGLEQLDRNDSEALLRAHRGRGVVRYRIARYEQSVTDLLAARDLAREVNRPEIEADILLDIAMAADWMGEFRRSTEFSQQAAPLVAELNQPLLEARLLQALGRSASRNGQQQEGADLFSRAIQIVDERGDEAYEILVTSLMHLGFVLPFFNRLVEAEEKLNRAIELCQSHGDELHLAGAYNNRACLWIACNARDRALEDMRLARHYANRLGIGDLERNVSYNLATYLYWLGQVSEAEVHVKRVIELDARRMRGAERPEGPVLLSRILWARGDREECERLASQIREQQAAAGREGRTEAVLFANDRVLLDAICLALGNAGDADWKPVLERARQESQGQELIEVFEIRGRAALLESKVNAAREAWQAALELGRSIPNVLEQRIRDNLSRL